MHKPTRAKECKNHMINFVGRSTKLDKASGLLHQPTLARSAELRHPKTTSQPHTHKTPKTSKTHKHQLLNIGQPAGRAPGPSGVQLTGPFATNYVSNPHFPPRLELKALPPPPAKQPLPVAGQMGTPPLRRHLGSVSIRSTE